MKTITSVMTGDHQQCDDLFVKVEEFVSEDNWEQAATFFVAFYEAIEHHFQMEEEILFPHFEKMTGMVSGPTSVMRSEHIHMRDLINRMSVAVEDKNSEDYLDHSETLLIILQQHNAKEEQVLYPMTDQSLGDNVEWVIKSMEGLSS